MKIQKSSWYGDSKTERKSFSEVGKVPLDPQKKIGTISFSSVSNRINMK